MFITNPEKDFMADMTTSDAERYLKEIFENGINTLKGKKELGYNDVIDQLNDFITHFGIDKEDLLITYGAALVLRGVKKFTSDIDLSISDFTFDRIRERYDDVQVFSKSYKDSHLCFKYEDIEVFRGVVGMTVFPESDLEQHCGFMVQTIKSIREEKLRRGRIKDMRDVDLIDKFLALEPFIAMPWDDLISLDSPKLIEAKNFVDLSKYDYCIRSRIINDFMKKVPLDQMPIFDYTRRIRTSKESDTQADNVKLELNRIVNELKALAVVTKESERTNDDSISNPVITAASIGPGESNISIDIDRSSIYMGRLKNEENIKLTVLKDRKKDK